MEGKELGNREIARAGGGGGGGEREVFDNQKVTEGR
jgi:hypothetical protein